MMDIIKTLLTEPLEQIFLLLYKGLYALSGNYVVSLFLLSLVTSIVMWRLSGLVAHKANEEKELQVILDRQIKKIREESTGAIRAERIRNLYKRYSYNPVYSVKAALGLLIQLPFLMGAYWMLSNFEPLANVSFGPIKDIARPDHLLWDINLLPFVMFLVGMINVFIIPNFSRKERGQAAAVNILFLVLLYQAPAALLIYWTTNNILSLINTLFGKYHYLVPKLSPGRYKAIGLYLLAVFLCLITSTKRFVVPSVLYTPLRLISDSCFLFLACYFCVECVRVAIVNHMKKQDVIIGIIVSLLFLFCFIRVCLYWAGVGTRHNLSSQLFLFVTAYTLAKVLLHFLSSNEFKGIKEEIRRGEELFYPGGVLILILVTLYFPIGLLASDPILVGKQIWKFIFWQLAYFEVGVIFLFLIHSVISKKVLYFVSYLICFLAVLAVIYGFFISINYGSIQNFLFTNLGGLYRKANKWNDVFVVVSALMLISLTLYSKKIMVLKGMFSFFICFSLVLTAFNLYKIHGVIPGTVGLDGKVILIPEKVKNFYTFSRHGKNIVVVLLDMFTGGNMKEILELKPEIADDLDGFIWFPDTVTSGSATILGKQGILGGEKATPYELNRDGKQNESLEERINKSWGNFLSILQKEKFNVSVHDFIWLRPELLNSYLPSSANLVSSFLLWDDLPRIFRHSETASFMQTSSLLINMFGIFRVAPLSLRKYIYDGGRWMGGIEPEEGQKRWYDDNVSQLQYLPQLSALSNTGNYFVFSSIMATHIPWTFNDRCEFCNPGKNGNCGVLPELQGNPSDYSKENSIPDPSLGLIRRKDGTFNEHLMSEICTLKYLIKWFSWMKDNGIYNNTEIILVSDHGLYDSSQLLNQFGTVTFHSNVHGLFLFKPFERRGKLKTENYKLVANWDVPDLIRSSLKGENFLPIWDVEDRQRCHVFGSEFRSRHSSSSFNLVEEWCIKGSMFNKKNWKKIK